MKITNKLFALLTLLALIFSALGATPAQASANLVAHWTLDDTYNDSVGSATGTPNNGPVFTSTYKAQGSHSLALNGGNQYVDLPYLLADEYTISLWVKPDNVSSRSILVYTAGDPTTSWSSQIRITSAGNAEQYLWDGSAKVVTGTTILTAGTWNFLTITAKNNGQEKLYVNGNPEGTPVSIGTFQTGGSYHFQLGSNSGSGMGYYDGLVDDVRIYDTQMSDAEVQALYNSYSVTLICQTGWRGRLLHLG